MFQGHCSDCGWAAPETHADEDTAWADFTAHANTEHPVLGGVRTVT